MRGQDERSSADILHDIGGNIQEILRSELQLAKTEIADAVSEARGHAVRLAAGLLLAVYALGLMLLAAMYALGMVMAMWSAALLIGVLLAVMAVVLITSGRCGVRHAYEKFDKTARTLRSLRDERTV